MDIENTIVEKDQGEPKAIKGTNAKKVTAENEETEEQQMHSEPSTILSETSLTVERVSEADNVLIIESNVLLTPLSTLEVCALQTPKTDEITNVGAVSSLQIPASVAPSNASYSGLSLLAQYASSDEENDSAKAMESDSDSIIEVPVSTTAKDYRNIVVEIESDSESDSSSESEGDVEYLRTIRKTIDQRTRNNADIDDDEEDDLEGDKKSKQKRQPPKVKGEMLLDDLPPIQDLNITVPSEECIELGRVHSIVDQLVLVTVLPDSTLLDLETVLFLECGRKVLGEVFDVLGQVADPMYCVRLNTHEQIIERGINVGDVVYVAPKTEYTQFVILSSLTKYRGSDASWENDVEPPATHLDYSDDEQERAARIEWRNKNRPSDAEGQIKRTRSEAADTPEESGSSSRRRFHPARPSSHQSNCTSNSWHSNLYRQPQRGGSFVSPNYNVISPPPQIEHYAYRPMQNQMFSQPPLPQEYYPYAQLPQRLPPHMQQFPPPMYAPHQAHPMTAAVPNHLFSTPPPRTSAVPNLMFSTPPPPLPPGTKNLFDTHSPQFG